MTGSLSILCTGLIGLGALSVTAGGLMTLALSVEHGHARMLPAQWACAFVLCVSGLVIIAVGVVAHPTLLQVAS